MSVDSASAAPAAPIAAILLARELFEALLAQLFLIGLGLGGHALALGRGWLLLVAWLR